MRFSLCSSDLGCTTTSLKGSPIGGIVPSPALIKIDISNMTCKDDFKVIKDKGKNSDNDRNILKKLLRRI